MRAELRFGSALVLAGAFVLVLTAETLAAQTLKGRHELHGSPDATKVLEVGDRPGHVMILAQARGVSLLEGGDTAQVTGTEVLDHSNGNGPYHGYEVLTFRDGSTIMDEFEGMDETTPDGKDVNFNGRFTITGGSGRFAGIRGKGTHRGVNHVAAGTGAFVDFEATYTLPKRP